MLRYLASFLLNPLSHFYLFLLLAVLLYWRGQRSWAKSVGIYSFVWLFLVSVSPLPVYLTQQREARYPVIGEDQLSLLREEGELNIIVLGAGHSNAPGYTLADRLSDSALKRLLEGTRLQQLLPQAKLICSGYSSTGQSQAAALAEMALYLGVSPQDTVLQTTARNTQAEARIYSERFPGNSKVIVVTSALHLPRAVYWFQHYGLQPIAAPTDHLILPEPGPRDFPFSPSIYKLNMSGKLLHEYAGMLYARLQN